jgi:NADPH:quinone reductase-like Zn-dependent oxidoreductase
MRMRAVVYLGDERVAWQEVPDPTPGEGEVVVAMRLAGLNHRDLWLLRGHFGARPGAILLSDGVGRVVAVGRGVSEALLGQEVVLNPSVGCGACPACAVGDEPACPYFRIYDGAGAERALVPARNVVPKPPELPDPVAAVVGLVFVTAYDMVLERAKVLPGERVLVWGATGGLGSAAVAMVHLVGGVPVAVGRDPAYLRALGAAEVVDRRDPEYPRRLEALAPFDVVLDSVGGETFQRSLKLLRRGGRLVTVGQTTGGEVRFQLGDLFRRRIALLGAFMGSRAALPRLLPLLASQRLKAPDVTVLPAARVAAAFAAMAAGEVRGKIALDLS